MVGNCEHCNRCFSCQIFHCGFSDSSYAYCVRCGRTAILDGWSKQWPKNVKLTQREIAPEMEAYLEPCECGGAFKQGSSPRCPHCSQALSAEKATEYIEQQSSGTQKGWRWQRNWSDIYCIVIDGRKVSDNFKLNAEN